MCARTKKEAEISQKEGRERSGRFAEGNQFWKLRSKHGRDKLFTSPELLWQAACEYFEWCDSHPLMEETIQKVKVNGEGERIIRELLPKLRPYTIYGLCLYLDVNIDYLNHFEQQLRREDSEQPSDFRRVITRIKDAIYTQKFEGAATGFFNPTVIVRDLGLRDKSDLTTDGKPLSTDKLAVTVSFTNMSK
jgi:hypothetical protein